MKRSNKKGFTIVELVIVIAIIAILAAVLIPTFASLIQKANVSKDTQLVRNLNTALSLETEKPTTMHEALEIAAEAGYLVDKINASASGNEILWDSKNNVFCYYKDGKVEYIPESATGTQITNDSDYYLLWKVYNKGETVPAADAQKFSIYLADGATVKDNKLDVTVGFDAGNNASVAEVTYTGTKSAVIRTVNGKLTVNAPSAHVEHYGLAKEVNVQAVSDSTYVEHGTVAKMSVTADAKNVVIKSTAVVVELTTASENVSIESNGYVGTASGEKASSVSGTVGGDTIKVGTYDQLQGLALSSTVEISLEGKTIELTADIDLTGKVWTPFGFSTSTPFAGTIDGNGHTIKGLSSNGYTYAATVANETNKVSGPAYGFVCIAKNATIKNIKFTDVNINVENGLAVGAVVGDARGNSLTIENITVDGSVKASDKVGGFVGLAGYNDSTNFELTIKDCTNNAEIVAERGDNYNRAGGFVGGLGDESKTEKVTLTNCTNNGNVTVTGAINKNAKSPGCIVSAAGFIGSTNANKVDHITATNCTNNGTITAKNTKTNGTKTLTEMADGGHFESDWVRVYPMYATYAANN